MSSVGSNPTPSAKGRSPLEEGVRTMNLRRGHRAPHKVRQSGSTYILDKNHKEASKTNSLQTLSLKTARGVVRILLPPPDPGTVGQDTRTPLWNPKPGTIYRRLLSDKECAALTGLVEARLVLYSPCIIDGVAV